MLQQSFFGPHIKAEVTIVSGVARQVEIFHPTKSESIIIPADWLCNVTDPVNKIIHDVKAALNGSNVIAV